MNAQLDQLENLICVGDFTPNDQPLVDVEAWTPNSGQGLLLQVDTEPSASFTGAELIAIDFPAFTDGRGLSLAVLLRERFGYLGELRAVGDINTDMLHYLTRCGFNTIKLTKPSVQADGSNATTGFNTLAPYSDNYQASVLEPEPAYRRVRRGA
jgi:uncharacterized protein (DUF934 family)